MIEDREDRDVDEATARPWYASMGVGGRRHVTTGGGLNAAVIATCFGEADAALIVEAVNAYDRLRAVEAAVGEWMRFGAGDGTDAAEAESESEHLLHQLAKVYQLSEVPSDAR